jgi:hypothetical protein
MVDQVLLVDQLAPDDEGEPGAGAMPPSGPPPR